MVQGDHSCSGGMKPALADPLPPQVIRGQRQTADEETAAESGEAVGISLRSLGRLESPNMAAMCEQETRSLTVPPYKAGACRVTAACGHGSTSSALGRGNKTPNGLFLPLTDFSQHGPAAVSDVLPEERLRKLTHQTP
ncbi:hypothetical protein NDU88_005697 [Pleurodeles waltl]|uniref:Uncharacterized protein n=1 Tax=Pleurodeles waltl TaxID=8319 RepID=A0AAV7VNN0_PLEWA|nr:hypothetical protein NDU88_005697 [Pleurodeles waltl]